MIKENIKYNQKWLETIFRNAYEIVKSNLTDIAKIEDFDSCFGRVNTYHRINVIDDFMLTVPLVTFQIRDHSHPDLLKTGENIAIRNGDNEIYNVVVKFDNPLEDPVMKTDWIKIIVIFH